MDKVKVELLTQHEHSGLVYYRGQVLELEPDQANWLIAAGKAKKVAEVRSKERDR